MLKYICNKCNLIKELTVATLIVVNDKVITKQAKCECGEYMQEVEKDFDGWPCIIRNENYNRKK